MTLHTDFNDMKKNIRNSFSFCFFNCTKLNKYAIIMTLEYLGFQSNQDYIFTFIYSTLYNLCQ